MTSNHKYSNARIEIDTVLTVDAALDIARQAVGVQHRLQIDEHFDAGFDVLIKSAMRVTQLHFLVSAQPQGERTRLSTVIVDALLMTQKLFYVIPLGGADMVGYPEYRRYMIGLGEFVYAADPTAHFTVVEEEGK